MAAITGRATSGITNRRRENSSTSGVAPSSTSTRAAANSSTSSGNSGFGGSANNIRTYSDQQRAIRDQMNENSKAWHNASTQEEKDALHARNEELSRMLGGSTSFDADTGYWSGEGSYGGMDFFRGNADSGFSYGNAPSYTDKYSKQIEELWKALSGYGYGDFLDSSQYSALAGQYETLGRNAMQDTLGQVAARTGGLASSYGSTAAQQSYNNYMQALEQAALDMYGDEYSRRANNLQTALNLSDIDYSRYLNDLNQYNTDRNFDYGVYSDDWHRDYTLKSEEYAKSQDAAQLARGQVDAMLAAGMMPPDSLIAASGYDPSYISGMNEYINNMTASSSAGSSKSGGGGNGGGSDSDSDVDYSGIVDTMLSFGDDAKAMEYLLSQNLSQWEYNTYAELYNDRKGQIQTEDIVPEIAMGFLDTYGVAEADNGRILNVYAKLYGLNDKQQQDLSEYVKYYAQLDGMR